MAERDSLPVTRLLALFEIGCSSAFFLKAIGDLKRRQVIGPGSSTIGEAVTSLEATFQKETAVSSCPKYDDFFSR